MHLKSWSALTVCCCAVSGWQRFWRSPWSSWRERAQSKQEEGELWVWWMIKLNKHHLRLLSVSKNKILQPLICRPHSRSCAVPCPYHRFRPDWWFRRHLQSSCVLQGWHIWILHQWNSLGCLPHLWEVWLTPEPLMQCLNQVWRRIIGAMFGVFWIWTLIEKETGQRSQMAFSRRKSDSKDHRGVFPDRLPCLILFGVITGPPEVGQSL